MKELSLEGSEPSLMHWYRVRRGHGDNLVGMLVFVFGYFDKVGGHK